MSCAKTAFKTEKQAQFSANRIERWSTKRKGRPKVLFPYKCSSCNYWHLTSKKMRNNKQVVEFTGCKFLDFQPHYDAKRQLTSHGLFWMREAQPSMVQFCKKRGRIYGCESCLSEQNKQCNDYSEILHSIEVPVSELK